MPMSRYQSGVQNGRKIHLWENVVLTANDLFGESGFNGLPTVERSLDDESIFDRVGVYGTWRSTTGQKLKYPDTLFNTIKYKFNAGTPICGMAAVSGA